jgi:hypothetical protein
MLGALDYRHGVSSSMSRLSVWQSAGTEPRLLLQLPARVRPGTTFEVCLELVTIAEVSFRCVELSLRGVERGGIAGGTGTVCRRLQLIDRRWRIADRGKLNGRRCWRQKITLPSRLPGSYRGRCGSVCYRLSARVGLGWGRSLCIERELTVDSGEGLCRDEPLRFSTKEDSGLQGMLTSSLLRPARPLRGSLNLTGSAGSLCGLTLALVGLERLEPAGRPASLELEACRLLARLDHRPLVQRARVDFSVMLPEKLPSSYRGRLIVLRWCVEVQLDRQGRRPLTLRLPVRVAGALAAANGPYR